MIWDSAKNLLTVEWIERKGEKDNNHILKKTPLRLQLHPTNGDVLRAYFKGARPSWISRYAKEKRYDTHEVKSTDGNGWWIANWSNYRQEERPLLCPFIKGMIEEWFENLPASCLADKLKLEEHIEVVEMNLLYHADIFKEWGLHFRPEELLQEHGALLLEKNLLPNELEEGVFDLADWPDYIHVVRELLELREIPDEVRVAARIEEYEEAFVLELPVTTKDNREDDIEMNEETVEILTKIDEEINEPLTDEFLFLDDSEGEELIFMDQTMEQDAENSEEFVLLDEEVGLSLNVPIVTTVELVEDQLLIQETEEPTQLVNVEVRPTLKISEKPSKKEDIIVGQTLLF